MATRLWKKYWEKRTTEHRNELVIHYLPLAHSHAHRFVCRIAATYVVEELLGAAAVGLINAVETFDEKHGLKFEIYSGYRIQGAIRDWLREMDTQSRTVRKFEKQKHAFEETLSHNGIHDADSVVKAMRISEEQYFHMNKILTHGKQRQLSIFVDKFGRDWDVEDKHCPDPTRTINRSFLIQFITKGLNRVDRMILVLYYFEGLTMHEIADIMDLSESRISQLRSQLMSRIRWNLRDTIYESERLLA